MQEGRGLKKSDLTTDRFQLMIKNSAIIILFLLHDVGTSFIASRFNFRDLFAGRNVIDLKKKIPLLSKNTRLLASPSKTNPSPAG